MLDSSTNGRLLQQSRSIRLRLSMMSIILARRGMGMNPPRRASVAEPLRCNRLTKGLKKTSCGPTFSLQHNPLGFGAAAQETAARPFGGVV